MEETKVMMMSARQIHRDRKNWRMRGILYDEKRNVLQMECLSTFFRLSDHMDKKLE